MPFLPEPTQPELQMADMLVEALVQPFAIDAYQDTYRVTLQARLEALAVDPNAAVPEEPPAPAAPAAPTDMMAVLKASLELARTRKQQVAV
jgi:non-homologous end joining protein Ku